MLIVSFGANSSGAQGSRVNVKGDSLQRSQPKVPAHRLIGAGVVGSAGGFAFGALLGLASSEGSGDSDEDFEGTLSRMALGGVWGQTLGMALGVHAANDHRGSLLVDIGVSTGWVFGFLAIGPGLYDIDPGAAMIIVASQLGVVIAAERKFGHFRRSRQIGLSLKPLSHGAGGLVGVLHIPVGF
jgi:hypothetical protein